MDFGDSNPRPCQIKFGLRPRRRRPRVTLGNQGARVLINHASVTADAAGPADANGSTTAASSATVADTAASANPAGKPDPVVTRPTSALDGAVSAPALTDDTNSDAAAVPGSADAPDPAVARPALGFMSDCGLASFPVWLSWFSRADLSSDQGSTPASGG